MIYEFILENKELLRVVYGLLIVFICSIIFLKTDRMFKLSDYQGLRYLRNAFLFYGIAFVIKFVLHEISINNYYQKNYLLFLNFFFEFFIIIAGFFLLYSLIWKYIEKEKNYHSILNFKMFVFYLLGFIIALQDFIFKTDIFLYLTMSFLFLLLIFISFRNYFKMGKIYLFYYFLIMVLGFLFWIIFMLNKYFLKNNLILIIAYAINLAFFLFFFYLIKNTTKKEND